MRAFWAMAGAIIAAWGSTLAAQETRVGAEGFVSPPATIYQMWWLEGLWQGEGIDGAPATESWLPSTGHTMVGTFVQQTPEGDILFSEHMYLVEEDGSLVLKLKHFNADLTGWEDKAGMVTFQLLSLDFCAAYFSGLTIRCDGNDKLVVGVRMKSDAAEPKELLFRFNRAARPQSVFGCDGTTIEMNECMSEILARSTERKDQYLAAALARHDDSPDVAKMIRQSDAASEAYRKQECYALYEDNKEGTIRNYVYLGCAIALVDERTRTIWQNWLTYADTTPPMLPEPGPSR
ncbi:uncharacterized protein YecT (DUF1311 family) [Erythromicrobium ramosum]|uniref:DUF1311 domain-containing protein n=1 Tax=Erythrobacter ramosus TaxID=35811 RepID=A0A6I4UIK6_9SPHN|nr:DUF6265 family protein [Erythrobacter ramosus]MBB3774742.1 uncharacterized protein YecT (DUF1311 family) [Erythrobacter ramosus]MXP37614.1 DUF1311 domain-containing protein [Erythrobacter ramosus]